MRLVREIEKSIRKNKKRRREKGKKRGREVRFVVSYFSIVTYDRKLTRYYTLCVPTSPIRLLPLPLKPPTANHIPLSRSRRSYITLLKAYIYLTYYIRRSIANPNPLFTTRSRPLSRIFTRHAFHDVYYELSKALTR